MRRRSCSSRAERRGVFRKLPAFERDLSEYPELAVLAENYAIIRAECESLIRQPACAFPAWRN